jgi:hypothetical protein
MQANTEQDALRLRLVRIGSINGLLELDGSPQGIYCASELGKRPIARKLHKAAAVACKGRFEALRPMLLQARKRASLIPSHKPGITDDVCRQNGGKLTLFAHAAPRTEGGSLPSTERLGEASTPTSRQVIGKKGFGLCGLDRECLA